MPARSLVALTGILSALFVASITMPASAGSLRQLVEPASPHMQSVPVKLSPEEAGRSDATPYVGKRLQHGLPATQEIQRRIKVVARCGTTNLYCNPPTPVCCGTPGKYYCARDASGCNQQR